MNRTRKVRNTDTAAANAKRIELADEFAREIYCLVENELKYEILANPKYRDPPPWYQIAKILNEEGISTRTGRRWTGNTVKLLYKRVRKRGLGDSCD
jgi:hypothetical protein